MPSPTFNNTDRVPSARDGLVSREVWGPEDLLPLVPHAPTGVSRFHLVEGFQYIPKRTFLWPELLAPKATAPGLFTEVVADSQNVQMLTASGAAPFIYGRGVGNFRLNNMLAVDTLGFNSTFLDLTGISPDVSVEKTSNALFFLNFGVVAFDDMGLVIDMAVNIDRSGWGVRRGLVVRAVGFSALIQVATNFAHIDVGVVMETPMLTYQGPQRGGAITTGALALKTGSSSFNIDIASTGIFGISDSPGANEAGTGDFFRPDILKAITLFAPADIAFLSVADSTLNSGVDTKLIFSSPQPRRRGDLVLVKGTSTAVYDGLHEIVRVSDDQTEIEINVAIGAQTAGVLQITKVTAVGHGLVYGETHTRSGTTAYNGTDQVLDLVDADNYLISVAFATAETSGTVISVNKNEETGVEVLNCGAQPNSSVVKGPIVAVADNIASFDGTSGRLVKDSGLAATQVPTQAENDALVGTNGAPGSGNPYVTDSDPRNTDARTPTAHDLGGAEHTADTLANLNAKVTDATLDDSSASRTPSGAAGGGLTGTYPNPGVDPAGHAHTHASTTGQTADDHHSEAHTVASHSDTTATGAELETLTDGSNADALHVHASAAVAHSATTGQTEDDHHNRQHGLGTAADHTSATLTQLNALVSDATLDDSSASRTPTGAAGGDLGGTYPNPTVDDGADGTAIHDNVSGEIAAVADKATPVGADLLLIEDSADSNSKKRIAISSLPDGNVFGSEYQYVEITTELSTNSATFQEYASMTTASIPAGTYRIEWHFICRNSQATGDWVVQVQVDDTINIISPGAQDQTREEGKDGTSTQRVARAGFRDVVLIAGVHNIDMDVAQADDGTATYFFGVLAISRRS